MGARSIAADGRASSCYFHTTVDGDRRKALVQIDERCNLRCAHCFVSATKQGQTMAYHDITTKVIPRLAACRVDRVTLTGGEPTIHPQFLDVVRAFRDTGMGVGVCTNATTLTDNEIAELTQIGGVHCNVSLDGFRPESHGKFRGDRASFQTTIATVKKLAAAGLLQGLLCTPNALAEDDEYRELCEFAVEHGAEYVLMNPLSSMGRGVKSRLALAATEQRMLRIHQMTDPFDGPDLNVTRIRFPNTEGKPLADCEAGTIIYVFAPGEVTVCPYPTVAQLVATALDDRAVPVHSTVEPTRTPLGEHIRAGTETYRGMALACLVAGDRHHHLAAEILPALRAGKVVVCDRYLPSSLVLQRLDGLDPEVIWQLNAGAYVPDVAVLLNAEHPVIAERLRARGAHSRFERQPEGSRAESDLYHQVAAQLRSVGWPTMALDCTIRRPATIAMSIVTPVLQTHAERSQA